MQGGAVPTADGGPDPGAEMAVDELIEVTGRVAIEAVLTLSAQELAGPKHPGKAAGEITLYGRQNTTIPLSERKPRVENPRLRHKGQGTDKEVPIPGVRGHAGPVTSGPANHRDSHEGHFHTQLSSRPS